MKKIGFVDYFISEWHANNYPAWIERICGEMGLDYKVSYAWAEMDVSPVDGVSTDEWCEKFGVKRCLSIAELAERSDYILILAPSNPEKHLEYAKVALKFGKRTYIDKTFTESPDAADEIYALSEKYGAPIFSSSALRYATELDELGSVTELCTTGGGRDINEYIIHQVEMIVKKLGVGFLDVKATAQGENTVFDIFYPDNRRARMIFGEKLGFTAAGNTDGSSPIQIKSPFFEGLISDILRFYSSGEVSFDKKETLEAMRLREAAIAAMEKV